MPCKSFPWYEKKINFELSIKDLFIHPTIKELSAKIAGSNAAVVVNPVAVIYPKPAFVPLSFGQERLWFIDQLEGSVKYHIPVVLRMNGTLHLDALNNALKTIIGRHEVLRTVIKEHEGKGYQHVNNNIDWEIKLVAGAQYLNDPATLQHLCIRLH